MMWQIRSLKSVFNYMPRIALLMAVIVAFTQSGCSGLGAGVAAPIVEQRLAAQKALSVDALTIKATEQGDLAATLDLAQRYASGNGVEQNGETALRLYRVVTASSNGYTVIAQTRIGRLYLQAVPPLKQDYIEAYLWFDRVIRDHGKYVTVDDEPVLRYHNFARLNMTDAERAALENRLLKGR